MGRETKSIYAFIGDNEFLKEEEQDKVISRCSTLTDQLEVIELDGSDASMHDIETAILSKAMFSELKVVRIRRVDNMSQSGHNRLADILTQVAGDTVVILTAASLDRRGKLMQTLKSLGTVKEFRSMYENEAVQWCRQRARHYRIKMGPREAELLVELAGTDLSRIDHELEKISIYLGKPDAVADKEVIAKVVGAGGDVVIFDLLDAIGNRNASQAIAFLRRLLQSGEHPVKIQFIISRHLRDLLLVASMSQSGMQSEAIVESLNMHPYRARKLLAQASNFGTKELSDALACLLSSDLRIKSSELTPACWLEVAIHRICGSAS